MKKLFIISILALILIIHVVSSNASVNECYLRIKSPATLEYSLENIKANRIILDMSLLEYKLADNSYIVLMFGYPPLNLYGFAIVRENNTTSFYSIRGSQNNWHIVSQNISDNIVIMVKVYNKTLEYELLSNGLVVDHYITNTSLNSLELRSIVITIASPYNSRNSWITFKKLVVTADNNIIVDLEANNNTLTEIKEEGLLYPNNRNLELVCIRPITVTETITNNYTTTISANSTTVTKTIIEKETYTTTLYSTLTITSIETITATTNITLTETNISTTTLTTTTTFFNEIPYMPVVFYGILLILIALVLTLLIVLLRRR